MAGINNFPMTQPIHSNLYKSSNIKRHFQGRAGQSKNKSCERTEQGQPGSISTNEQRNVLRRIAKMVRWDCCECYGANDPDQPPIRVRSPYNKTKQYMMTMDALQYERNTNNESNEMKSEHEILKCKSFQSDQ